MSWLRPEAVVHDARGLGDGDTPDVAFQPPGAAPDACYIATELDLCVALAGWEPWALPSAQLLQAVDQARRIRGVAPAAMDTITTCARRFYAIAELAYEEKHFEHLPESYR